MDCPVCRKPLIVAERGGIELDCCPVCRGLWFDAGELALLAEKAGRTLRLESAGAPGAAGGEGVRRRCPRCDRRLETIPVGGAPRVECDRCPAGHGFWFDKGEVGSLMEQMSARPASPPEALLLFLGETLGPGAAARGTPAAANVPNPEEETKR